MGKKRKSAMPRRPPSTEPSRLIVNDDANVPTPETPPVHAQLNAPVRAPFVGDADYDDMSIQLCSTCSRRGTQMMDGDTRLARCSGCGVPSYCSKTWCANRSSGVADPGPANRSTGSGGIGWSVDG